MFDKYEEYFKNQIDINKNKFVPQAPPMHTHKHGIEHAPPEPLMANFAKNHYYEWNESERKWEKIISYSPEANPDWEPGTYDGEIRRL